MSRKENRIRQSWRPYRGEAWISKHAKPMFRVIAADTDRNRKIRLDTIVRNEILYRPVP